MSPLHYGAMATHVEIRPMIPKVCSFWGKNGDDCRHVRYHNIGLLLIGFESIIQIRRGREDEFDRFNELLMVKLVDKLLKHEDALAVC